MLDLGNSPRPPSGQRLEGREWETLLSIPPRRVGCPARDAAVWSGAAEVIAPAEGIVEGEE